MEKVLLESVTAQCKDWNQVLATFKKCCEESSRVTLVCLHLLQKSNSIYPDVSCLDSYHGLHSLLTQCWETLDSSWRDLDSKNRVNLAKIITHLSVKILQQGDVDLCLHLCDLLTQLVSDECLDASAKDRQSISGYVYKALWNHSVNTFSTSSTDTIIRVRLSSLQLAVVGTCVSQPAKLCHQLSVALPETGSSLDDSTSSTVRSCLLTLYKCACVAVRRLPELTPWKYLSFYVYCTLIMYESSTSLTLDVDVKITEPLPELSSLVSHIINSDADSPGGDADNTSVSCQIRRHLSQRRADDADEILPLQALILLLSHRLTKQQLSRNVTDSVKDSMIAQVMLYRKVCQLTKDDSKLNNVYTNNLVNTVVKSLDITVTMVTNSQTLPSKIALLLRLDASMLADMPDIDSSYYNTVVNRVGKILQVITGHGMSSCPADLRSAISEVGLMALRLPVAMESVICLQKQLCDLLSKAADFSAALDVFRSALQRLSAQEQAWPALVSDWVRIKKKANLSADRSVTERILAVEGLAYLSNRDDVVRLIYQEFHEYGIKEAYTKELSACLKALKSHGLTTLHTAVYCVCMAEYKSSSAISDAGADDCVSHGLERLTECLSVYSKDLKAQLLMWRYIQQYKRNIDMGSVTEALVTADYQADSAVTYHHETDCLTDLYTALDMWMQCADDGQSVLYSPPMSMECLDILAHSFYLSHRWQKVIQIYNLYCKLQTPAGSSEQVAVSFSLQSLYITVLIRLGQTGAAKSVLGSMCSRGDNYTADVCDSLQYLKALLYVYDNKAQRAVELLEELLDKNSRASLENYYISASSHRLLLEIIMNCTGVKLQRSMAYHAWHCQRDHSSILTSISKYPIKSYAVKLRYVDTILSSYVTLGAVNLYVGNVRETDCFLKAALNLARLLNLPLRVADIMTMQCRYDCFIADLDSATSRLRHAHTILTSKISVHRQAAPPAAQRQRVSSKAPKSSGQKTKSGAVTTNLFGFDSDSDMEDTGETSPELNIQQPQGLHSDDEDDAEYKVPKYGRDTSKDLTASPLLNRKKSTLIRYADHELTTHVASCSCAVCEELCLHIYYITLVCTASHHLLHTGEVSEAINLSQDALALVSKATQRFDLLMTSATGQVNEPSMLTNCKLLLHEVTLSGYIRLGQPELVIGADWDALLQTAQHHSYHNARLEYTRLLPYVLHYHQTRQQVMEGLSARLHSLSIDKTVSSPLQPIKTNNKSDQPLPTKVIKAPRKTRRAFSSRVSKLAFNDSDSEAEQESKKSSGRTKPQKSSLLRLLSPVHSGLSSVKSGRSNKMSVYCDNENIANSTSKPLTSKKSGRRKQSAAEDQTMLGPVKTRSTRSTNKELARSDPDSSQTASQDMPVVMASPVPRPAGSPSDDDDIELPRGDTKQKTGRKYSATESMRSSMLRSTDSSPPDILQTSSPDIPNPSHRPVTHPIYSGIEQDELVTRLETLQTALKYSRPYTLYRTVCQSLGILYFNRDDLWTSAFYLCESQAITFTHKANLSSASKLHTLSKEKTSAGDHSSSVLQLPDYNDLASFKQAINSLPADWTMTYLHVISSPAQAKDQYIYMTRLAANAEPAVMCVNQSPQTISAIWRQFEDILSLSKDSMSEVEKPVWWEKRRDIDSKLKELLAKTQQDLGVVRSFLVGRYTDRKSNQWVDKCTNQLVTRLTELDIPHNQSTIRALVNSAAILANRELSAYFLSLCPTVNTEVAEQLSALVKDGVAVMIDTRAPLILALDKDAHALCWESMSMLSEQAVYRMPSIYTVQSYLSLLSADNKSVYNVGIDDRNAFYILNPDNNLPSTEKLFKPLLSSKKGWNGITGRKPTVDEYKQGLTTHDLFLFLGHGSGSKYLKGRVLSQVDCHAAVLLMGCSSGALDARGSMEPYGIIYDYHLAVCPSVMACLWDVTDKDIDRFTQCLLTRWLSKDRERVSLVDHINKSRQACKLPHLVGSASVIYGLPVSVRSA